MKKILIGALMVITSYGAQSQNNLIDVEVYQTPTIEETQMIEQVQDTISQAPHHLGHRPPMRPGFGPNVRQIPPMARMPLLPKPQQIIRKGDKVILIFTKSDWARYENIKRWHYLRNKRKHETEIGWQKRPEQNSIKRGFLERNPNR